jgi:hypothetical protein
MRRRERRQLLLIERHLVAEAPELAALFDAQTRPRRRADVGLVAWWSLVGLLVLGVLLADTTVVLGAYALLSASVVRWIVRSARDDTGHRPP